MSDKKNKKRNGFVRFIFGILWFILGIIIAITAWFCFSSLDRGKNLNFINSNYSAGIHTNSLYETLAPLIDLKAADTFLSQGDFSKAREVFMQIRSSKLRENFFVQKILGRRIDAAVYIENSNAEIKTDFIAVLDLGFLSAATRLAPYVLPFIHIENLNCVQTKNTDYNLMKNYFEYILPSDNKTENNQFNHFYIKCFKNLVIVSNSQNIFETSLKNYGTNTWNSDEEKLFTKKAAEPLKIIFNTKVLVENFIKNNMISEVKDFFTPENKSILNLGISDYEIRLNANIPMNLSNEENLLTALLNKNSNIPAIYNYLGNDVQYYTALNFGSLEELKNSIFPVLNKTQDMDSLWKTADSLSKSLFNVEINDLLFSWTTGECIVFGIEKSTSPVFGIEISDEKKRAEIFNKVLNSFILESNTSLIINGIRLSAIEFPPFINMLLNAFKINLPHPYFFVNKNYIYFSESAQNLVSVYNKEKQKELLITNENWKKVSAKMNDENSFSMFYNLERSMPFFLEGDSAFVKVLKLYNLGRVNLTLKNSAADISLHAISVSTKENLTIPGFPINLEGRTNYVLLKDNAKKVQKIYWTENAKKIILLNTQTLEKYSYEFEEKISVSQDSSGNIWAVTQNGNVYLFDETLNVKTGFPANTGFIPTSDCVSSKDGILFTSENGSFIQVNSKGEFTQNTISADATFKSSPAVLGDTVVFYNKGFEGELYIFKNGQFTNLDNPMIIDGIGYGTPALAKKGGNLLTAFITQSGDFYLFNETNLVKNYPIALDNIFYTNAVYFDGAFYTLSQDAILYKINLDGSFICVKLPEVNTAKEGIIYAENEGKNKGLYVCGDSNIIYGFNSNLEMLPHYPLAGRGIPVWTDINKDKIDDILILSVDKKLHAWSLK